jgi:hypothetical protein
LGSLQIAGFTGGGTAIGTTIVSNGQQYVGGYGGYGGEGTATCTTISGGEQLVGYGSGIGTATSTTVLSGGAQLVGKDGTAIG